MSNIKIPMQIEGSKMWKIALCYFDLNATYSCIDMLFAEELGIITKIHKPHELIPTTDKDYVNIEQCIRLDFYYDDIRMSDEFMVIPDLTEDIIIGGLTMQKWGIKLGNENEAIIINPNVANHILKNLI